jgi:tetratricopeptide (TPR) repeat protein
MVPLLLCLSAAPAPAPRQDAPEVRRCESAQAQLGLALSLKHAMRGTRGRERMERRLRAAEAYRAVRAYFPKVRDLGAEAAFRAGELLRAGDEDEGALSEFSVARDLAPGGAFAARASIEIGHLRRRAGDAERALDAYLAVAHDGRAAPRWRDDASIWAGRTWFDLGRVDEARRAWRRVAERADEPLDRIRAHDELALAAVAEGDLEAAAGVLERCRRALADVALEETRRGERVRNALLRMRAIDELRRAVARRRDAVRIDGRK